MTQFNSKENKNLYSTGIIPTFTFVTDGPEVHSKHSKHGNGTRQHQRRSESTDQVTTNHEHQQQTLQQKEHDDTTATNDMSGPLHITPSWQPLDANEKPPYSYATLIAHSILSSEHRRLTLCDIYQWITQHYPFYSMVEHGWKNSIRHNLSLNKAFVRVQRSSTMVNSGKGSFWTIRPGQELVFIDNLIKRRGPIRKQSVILPRSLHYRRSSRLDSSSSTRHITNSPLFTTFRMTPAAAPTMTPTDRSTKRKRSMPELRQRQTTNNPTLTENEIDNFDHDSDCDSGIDVSNECDKLKDRRRRHSKPQLKKAKSAPCLFSDSLDNTSSGVFQDLLFTSSDFAAVDVMSSNWTNPTNLLSSPDSIMSPFLDWSLFPATTPDSIYCMDTNQDSLLSSDVKTIPSSILDTTTADTFSSLDNLANDIIPLENFASYDTTANLPSSTCLDSFSMDDFLLDDQTLMADWHL